MLLQMRPPSTGKRRMRNVARGVTAIMRMHHAATVSTVKTDVDGDAESGAGRSATHTLNSDGAVSLHTLTETEIAAIADGAIARAYAHTGGAPPPLPTPVCAPRVSHAPRSRKEVPTHPSVTVRPSTQWVPCALLDSAQRHSRAVASRALLVVANIAALLSKQTKHGTPSLVALRRSMAFRMNVDHPHWHTAQRDAPPVLMHSESTQRSSNDAFKRVRLVAEGTADWLHVSDLTQRDIESVDRALAYAPTGHASRYVEGSTTVGSWTKEVLGAMASVPPLPLAVTDPISRTDQAAFRGKVGLLLYRYNLRVLLTNCLLP